VVQFSIAELAKAENIFSLFLFSKYHSLIHNACNY